MSFQFNPVTGLNDASQFPDEDPLIRQHLQALLQQIPDYIDAELVHKEYNILTPTLINGWVNSGGAFETTKYWKDDLNIVHLQGTVGEGTNAIIFTLPVGYRPLHDLYVSVAYVNGSSVWDNGVMIIHSNGNVSHVNVPTGNTESLNGITFLAEQ